MVAINVCVITIIAVTVFKVLKHIVSGLVPLRRLLGLLVAVLLLLIAWYAFRRISRIDLLSDVKLFLLLFLHLLI